MEQDGHRRSERATEKHAVPKVLVFDGCFCGLDQGALSLLGEQGFDVVHCRDSQALLEEIVQNAPGVVVFGLGPDSAEELGVLQLVRRVLPNVPLILFAANGSLDTQRLVQSLRPIYYAVCPVEPVELRDAVSAALARPRRGSTLT